MDQAAAQLAHLPEHLARMEAMILGDDGELIKGVCGGVGDCARARVCVCVCVCVCDVRVM